MIEHVWEFYVKPKCEIPFETLNGPDGKWAEFFRNSPDFYGTYFKKMEMMLKDEKSARRYLTHDRWTSEEAFSRYIEETEFNQKEFQRLSQKNSELIVGKEELGWF